MGLRRATSRRLAGWRGGVLLLALCAAAFLPGLFLLPPIDRDESRFAQASRQMAESGSLEGWAVPRIQNRPRLNKPPLIYWLQAASARLFGDVPGALPPPSSATPSGPGPAGLPMVNPAPAPASTGLITENIWQYRLPSALGATLAVLLLWRLGLSMFGGGAATLGAALLAACPVVMFDARQARADQLLLACTVLAMLALWRLWRAHLAGRPTAWRSAGFWAAVGLGVLAKGPITPMIALLAAAALAAATRRWRFLWADLRPLRGLLIVALMVGPWVAVVAHEYGLADYAAKVYRETLGRSMEPKEGHWGPPGYHLVLLPVLFWPGSLLTALAVARAFGRAFPPGRDARSAGTGPGLLRRLVSPGAVSSSSPELFLLAWAIPGWVVFEVISTKLPHYTLPLYPALALLSARAVLAAARGAVPGARGIGPALGFWLWLVIGAALAVAAPALLIGALGLSLEQPGVVWAVGSAMLAAGLALLAARAFLSRGRFLGAQLSGVVASVITGAMLFHLVLPRLQSLWLSSRIVEAAAVTFADAPGPLGAVGYHEDSLLFLTRGRAVRLSAADADAWIDAHPAGLVIGGKPAPRSPAEVRRRSDVLMLDLGSPPPSVLGGLPAVHGFNYSTGDWVTLQLRRWMPPS
ncbi:MAG: glycosyltransferase family 39 protein [Phycisphaerales bacterium]|nr:glycosyltransferase family 39 protein [Phycisphaerales bacterium]